MAVHSFVRAMGFDDPALIEAVEAATWDRPEHLSALSNALMRVAHDEDDPDRQFTRLCFITGVAAAALSMIAERMRK